MGNKNTNNLRESVLENDTLNNNNNHNEDECTEKQRGVWTHDRDLIYMKRLVECYPPSQGRGNTAKAWKDLQAAVNSIDQDQGQLQKTTVKSRGAVLIDEYLKRKKIQQESTGTSGDYTNLDRWIRKHLTMVFAL
ncbi:hypothetical protein K501DRAFT_48039 [Backusella circina FSU 941]|nr:hypothetical protein K501DRAFT_48039 [Backusella circina FSU 941]